MRSRSDTGRREPRPSSGYEINVGGPVTLADFVYDVAGLVSSFSECRQPTPESEPTCIPLDSPTSGLVMHPPCELGAEGCQSVRSESGTIVARKVMDVALRLPARSALYEILPGTSAPAGSEPAVAPAITSITNPSASVRFIANGRYFVLQFSAEPVAGAEVLTIVYGDGTTDEVRISYP